MKGVVAGFLLALAIAYLAAEPGHAMTCGDVSTGLAPCLPYLTGTSAAPAAGCCEGVKKLRAMAATTADRRFACNCMKQAAAHLALKGDAVSNLPKECGTPLPFPISLDYDCSKRAPIT